MLSSADNRYKPAPQSRKPELEWPRVEELPQSSREQLRTSPLCVPVCDRTPDYLPDVSVRAAATAPTVPRLFIARRSVARARSGRCRHHQQSLADGGPQKECRSDDACGEVAGFVAMASGIERWRRLKDSRRSSGVWRAARPDGSDSPIRLRRVLRAGATRSSR